MRNANKTEVTVEEATEQTEAEKKKAAEKAEWRRRIAASVIGRAIWDGIKWVIEQISEL